VSGTAVGACAPGNLCLGEFCRAVCSPSAPRCAAGETCQSTTIRPVCAPPGADLTPTYAKTVNGTTGCGCGAGGPGAAGAAWLSLWFIGRRRGACRSSKP
jgi:hypothetical protein